MTFLQKLFAEGESLTWDQLRAKIEADKNLKIVNLSDGGYISKEKHDAAIATRDTKISGLETQLSEANTTIQSYKDMDPEGAKKAAADWEQKYAADTKALQDKLDAQATEFAAKTYLAGFQYTDDLVREAIYAKFMAKKFKLEGDKFVGADEFMAEMQKAYPSSFVTKPDPEPNPQPNPQPQPQPQPPKPNPAVAKPWFAPQQPPANPTKKRSLLELMKYKNEHPDAQINFDE